MKVLVMIFGLLIIFSMPVQAKSNGNTLLGQHGCRFLKAYISTDKKLFSRKPFMKQTGEYDRYVSAMHQAYSKNCR